MADYRKIMLLLLQGRSYRQVQALLNCSPRTISKARQVIDEQKFSTPQQLKDLSDEVLEQCFADGRKSVSTSFVPIDIDAVIKARIGRKKPPLKVLWARYLRREAAGPQRHYQYERFCQLIAELQGGGGGAWISPDSGCSPVHTRLLPFRYTGASKCFC